MSIILDDKPRMKYGRHKGALLSRVPVAYLRYVVRNRLAQADEAQTELDRRGAIQPHLDVSGHAIDRASTRLLDQYRATRHEGEGMYAWLMRLASAALNSGTPCNGKIHHKGLIFAFDCDGEWPVLKSIMPNEKAQRRRTGKRPVESEVIP